MATIQENPRAGWSPPARCSVAPPREPDPIPWRMSEKEAAAVREVVALRGRSPAARHLDKAVSMLARHERTSETARALGDVLDDRSLEAVPRAVAAVELARMPAYEAEPALLKHLRDPDAMVRQRVVHALGAVGGEEALRALDELDDAEERPGVRAQAAFARRLIRYRLGDGDVEAPEPRGTRWDPEGDGKPQHLPMRKMGADETYARIAGLAGQTYGIAVDDAAGFAIGRGDDERHILLSRELAGKEGWARLRERPAIAALVTARNDPAGGEAVHLVVLTAPVGDQLRVHGYRSDGALVFDGQAPIGADAIPFVVTSTDRPGQCRYRVSGTLVPGGVRWDRHETLPRRRGKRLTVPLR